MVPPQRGGWNNTIGRTKVKKETLKSIEPFQNSSTTITNTRNIYEYYQIPPSQNSFYMLITYMYYTYKALGRNPLNYSENTIKISCVFYKISEYKRSKQLHFKLWEIRKYTMKLKKRREQTKIHYFIFTYSEICKLSNKMSSQYQFE